jgi:MFS family permease
VPFVPSEAAAARGTASRGTTRELFRDRALARIFFVSVLAQSTWSIVQFLVPLYGAQIGLNASAIGMLMGAFAAATVVVRVFTPWLSRRFTSWQLMISSLVVAGLGFAGMPAAAGFIPIASFVFIMGLGLGLSGPIAQALVYEASPPARIGEVLGLRVTMMNVSHTAVPLVFGALGTAVGVGPVFWMLAAIQFAGSWLTRRQWRRLK